MIAKTRTQLPGLSRSTACSKRACRRLDGHKGKCRPTLTRRSSAAKVEVLSADKYTVLPDATAEGRDVQRIGNARRAKAAPAGTKSRSNAGALKGRVSRKAGTR